MADYQIDDIVSNPDTGQKAQLKNVGGELKWEILDSPATLTGFAKAAGSGLLHQAIPDALGSVGDLEEMKKQGVLWAGDKMRGIFGAKKPEEGEEPGTYDKVVGALSKVPLLPMMGTHLAPKSEDIKGVTTQVAPEYEPQNLLERATKATVGFLPGAVAAPEVAGARLLPRVIRSIGRYAVAPGVASEAAGDLPLVKGTAAEPWVKGGVALATPGAVTKFITPNPATAERLRAARELAQRGATFTPGQLSGSSKQLASEGKALEATGSGSRGVENVNEENRRNLTRGFLREFDVPPGAPPAVREAIERGEASPPVRQAINNHIDREFDHLTRHHDTLLDSDLQRTFNGIRQRYDQEAILSRTPEVGQYIDRIEHIFNTGMPTSRSNGRIVPGWIDGRTYQNMRSDLSNLAVDAATPQQTHAYSALRDALDAKMEQAVRHFDPADEGRFTRVRDQYRNRLILDRAMQGQSDDAAAHLINPKSLGQASQRVLGAETFSMQRHPTAQYARAAQQILTPLKPPAHAYDNHLHLATVLAGGAALGAGGSAALEKNISEHGSPLGYLAGAAVGAIPAALFRPGLARLMRTAPGHRYLSNQMLPSEARPGALRNPANAALMAELLAQKRRPGPEQQ